MTQQRKRVTEKYAERLFRGLLDRGQMRLPELSGVTDERAEKAALRMRLELRKGEKTAPAMSPAILLRERRVGAQLSVSRLAKCARVDAKTYRSLEDGRLRPEDIVPEAFAQVLKALEVTYEEYVSAHALGRPKGTSFRVAAVRQTPAGRGRRRTERKRIGDWLSRLRQAMEEKDKTGL